MSSNRASKKLLLFLFCFCIVVHSLLCITQIHGEEIETPKEVKWSELKGMWGSSNTFLFHYRDKIGDHYGRIDLNFNVDDKTDTVKPELGYHCDIFESQSEHKKIDPAAPEYMDYFYKNDRCPAPSLGLVGSVGSFDGKRLKAKINEVVYMYSGHTVDLTADSDGNFRGTCKAGYLRNYKIDKKDDKVFDQWRIRCENVPIYWLLIRKGDQKLYESGEAITTALNDGLEKIAMPVHKGESPKPVTIKMPESEAKMNHAEKAYAEQREILNNIMDAATEGELVKEAFEEDPEGGGGTRKRTYKNGANTTQIVDMLDGDGNVIATFIVEDIMGDESGNNVTRSIVTSLGNDGSIRMSETKNTWNPDDYEKLEEYMLDHAYKDDGVGYPDIQPLSSEELPNDEVRVTCDDNGRIIETRRVVVDPDTGKPARERIDKADAHKTSIDKKWDSKGRFLEMEKKTDNPETGTWTRTRERANGSYDIDEFDAFNKPVFAHSKDADGNELLYYKKKEDGSSTRREFNPESSITRKHDWDADGGCYFRQTDREGKDLVEVGQSKSGSLYAYKTGLDDEDYKKSELISSHRYDRKKEDGKIKSRMQGYLSSPKNKDLERQLEEVQKNERTTVYGNDILVETDFHAHRESYKIIRKDENMTAREIMKSRNDASIGSAVKRSRKKLESLPIERPVRDWGLGRTRKEALHDALSSASQQIVTKIEGEMISYQQSIKKKEGSQITEIYRDAISNDLKASSSTAISEYNVTGVSIYEPGWYRVDIEAQPGVATNE